eukprot:UN25080
MYRLAMRPNLVGIVAIYLFLKVQAQVLLSDVKRDAILIHHVLTLRTFMMEDVQHIRNVFS